MPVDVSTSVETLGLTMAFIVLKRIWGLLECLLIISEKCLALAFLAAVWKAANEFLKMSKETLSLSLFHFHSTLQQACLREQVMSSRKGCDLGLQCLSLRVAMKSKLLEQDVLIRDTKSSMLPGSSFAVEMDLAASLLRKHSEKWLVVRELM